ncbi:MAG: leucyl-tRNA synthetase [Parcubacteria bacterium C7867-004]|nr:MAG: leucyl-tRNA synthetase [Parcubacteria bacterium C7867-004]
MHKDIRSYNAAQSKEDTKICNLLMAQIDRELPNAESKIWHAHPVWFLEGNPIVGYSKLKDSVRLLFWSGQSFDEKDLKPEGSFKAAEARYTETSQIREKDLHRWLTKAKTIQWDYKNIVKRKGTLVRLS